MTTQDENTIVTCGAVVIACTTLRDMLPPERGGTGEGFQATHLLGGMAATTLLLLFGNAAPELAKAFGIMTATVAFLYGGATIAETFFLPEKERVKKQRGGLNLRAHQTALATHYQGR